MSFVDDLKRMTPPEKKEEFSFEERMFRERVSKAHGAVREKCVADRAGRRSKGYIIHMTGSNFDGEGEGYVCVPRLYERDYPFRISLKGRGYEAAWKDKNRREILQLCTDGTAGFDGDLDPIVGAGERDRYLNMLRELLKEDGFKDVKLEAVPAYWALVRRKYTFGAFEEGNLTDRLAGYVVYYEVAW